MDTASVMRLLAARYKAPAYAFLQQVRSSTGFSNAIRTADALAMSLWPSQGLEMHGFEVKVSRSDWQKELADPSKAERIAQFCHRWWIVAGSADIVKPAELPTTWGLLVPRGDSGLAVKVHAPLLPAEPMSMGFLAAILRRVQECTVPAEEVSAKVRDAIQKTEELHRKQQGRHENRAQSELEILRRDVEAFEAAAGIRITDTFRHNTPAEMGRAVAAILRGEKAASVAVRELRDAKSRLDRAVTMLDRELVSATAAAAAEGVVIK